MYRLLQRIDAAAKLAVSLAAVFAIEAQSAWAAEKLNVLMIAVDDLKPALGCYGDELAVSPNIDGLAVRGVRFTSAYVQQAVCSASRSSILTGRRPDTTGVIYADVHFRDQIPDVVTLPQHFNRNGFHTQAIGKIFHGGLDDRRSWSAPTFRPRDLPGYGPEGSRVIAERMQTAEAKATPAKKRSDRFKGPAWEVADVEDDELPDGQIANQAIETLQQIKDKPFFLAVGFFKPHLPFVAPAKYWKLHDSQMLGGANESLPVGAPECAVHSFTELRKYAGMPAEGPASEDAARKLIHGYYASISYMDAQLGRVLAELDRLGLRDNTIVVLWGDHGWHLGDKGLWCKHTNYEAAVHVPLIISAPGLEHASEQAAGIVELVNLYPTLADLCNLPTVAGAEGLSFKPLIEEPSSIWKPAAFTQYPRKVAGHRQSALGRAIRTKTHRLVEWKTPDGEFLEYELYDEVLDPEESRNLASDPGHADILSSLQQQLVVGWQAAKPTASATVSRHRNGS